MKYKEVLAPPPEGHHVSLYAEALTQVHGQHPDGGAGDRVPYLLQGHDHHQRGGLCQDPAALHQRGEHQCLPGERPPEHP